MSLSLFFPSFYFPVVYPTLLLLLYFFFSAWRPLSYSSFLDHLTSLFLPLHSLKHSHSLFFFPLSLSINPLLPLCNTPCFNSFWLSQSLSYSISVFPSPFFSPSLHNPFPPFHSYPLPLLFNEDFNTYVLYNPLKGCIGGVHYTHTLSLSFSLPTSLFRFFHFSIFFSCSFFIYFFSIFLFPYIFLFL